jgi:hypothetical protein
MNWRRNRWAQSLLATAGLLAGPAVAQAPEPAPYVDRVIEGITPEEPAPQAAYDDSGWPRYLRWDLRAASRNQLGDVQTRWGTALYGQIETPNHGSMSLDANGDLHGGGGTFTLRQRGMPIEGGWLANHEFGLITAPSPGMFRRPSRVFVPSPILRGLSADWGQPQGGWAFQATVGDPGQLSIYPDTRFERLPGNRTRLGGEWSASPGGEQGLAVAAQYERARDITPGASSGSASRLDADATLLGLRHAGNGWHAQGQWMQSRAQGTTRNGFWVDTEWDDQPVRWGAGVYRLDTDLRWTELPMASDLEGGYLRGLWRQRQWTLDGSLDLLRSLRPGRNWGHYATLNGRWRLSRDSSLGSGLAWREFSGRAGSAYVDWRFVNGQGQAGLRLEHSFGLGRPDNTELSYDQDWRTQVGWSLSTSLGAVIESADPANGLPGDTLLKAAVSLNGRLGNRGNLFGSLTSERGSDGRDSHNLSFTAQWRLTQRWSLEGTFTRVLGRPRLATSLDPLVINALLASTADRSYLVLLRYQFEAGSRDVPLGGGAGAGSGRVEGMVFFDANRNGVQEASEQGVPGVTIYLDNRYAVRTDNQGRFEFPSVATGARSVTLRNETLPLPWNVVDDGQARIEVRLRETIRVQLPVQRPE